MSRRSTVTVREQPIADVTALGGAVRVHSESLTVETVERFQMIDLTERVMTIVRGLGVKEGIVNLFSMHTTCTVFINEHQAALLADIRTFLERVVDREGGWRHNDPAQSDCDRQNADSHLRAMLLGHSLTLQVSGGEAVLGQWQRLLLAELDGPRTRTIRLMTMGIG
jgi:secondary thiamine-phosphate synthase enzyme